MHDVVERTRTIARLEAELATLELKEKARGLATGMVALAVATVLGLFAVGYLTATVAAALAGPLPTPLALLVVAFGLLVLAAVAGLAGVSLLRRATPPVPEAAIHEARLTAEALRSDGHG